MAQIAPSILSADFARLGEEVGAVERGGAGLLHVDIMDGHFVPNITIGPPVVASLRRVTRLPLDCHLMIEEPDRYLEDFAKAGANWISVHQEAVRHLHRTVSQIRALGMRAGVAINPATPVTALAEIAGDLDVALCMTVNPGWGGQAFIERSIEKIARVRAIVGDGVAVEVDGGIEPDTAARSQRAGANLFVAGSAIFDAPDPGEAYRQIAQAVGAE